MNLSKNFTLEEMCETTSHLPNVPNQQQIDSLKLLVEKVTQPARDLMGIPIHINSGFRSLEVNRDKGGADSSQHCKGEANDMDCADNAKLFNLIKNNFLFDQLIWEGGNSIQPDWVHVSYKKTGNRKQCLRMKIINGKKTYLPL